MSETRQETAPKAETPEVTIRRPARDAARAWRADVKRIEEAVEAVKKSTAETGIAVGRALIEARDRGNWAALTKKGDDGKEVPRYRDFREVIPEVTPFQRAYGYQLMAVAERISVADVKQLGIAKAVRVATIEDKAAREKVARRAANLSEREVREEVRKAKGIPARAPRAGGTGASLPTDHVRGMKWTLMLRKTPEGIMSANLNVSPTTTLRVALWSDGTCAVEFSDDRSVAVDPGDNNEADDNGVAVEG